MKISASDRLPILLFHINVTLQIAEYTSDPICRGIYAADSRELSMLACFPELFNMEKKYGSLIRGAPKVARGLLSSSYILSYAEHFLGCGEILWLLFDRW